MNAQTTPSGLSQFESNLVQACDRALEELTLTRLEQAELARQAAHLGALLAGNGTASQREQGIRDLIEALVRASGRSELRFAELAAALAQAGISARSAAAGAEDRAQGEIRAERLGQAQAEGQAEARTDLTGF